jgi:hypothetical protein
MILDLAIFIIALHTMLQIFQPKVGGYGTLDNGLYPWRYYVYGIAAVLPTGWTALSFVGTHGGFVSQGPTCSLPLRPYWYRLAISWIPRYVIMIVVVTMYSIIYVHVGRQNGTFSLFGLFKVKQPWETVVTPSRVIQTGIDGVNERKHQVSRYNLRVDTGAETGPTQVLPRLDIPEKAASNHSRKISDGTTLVSQNSMDFAYTKPILVSPQYNEDTSRLVAPRLDGMIDRQTERKRSLKDRVSVFVKSPISPTASAMSPLPPPETQLIGKKIMTKHMQKRQNAIQRQLGLLFLYPLCYFITYVPPFVSHAMNYSDYYVQHPIFGLNIVSFICLASLGWVDTLVFSLREKPWRHIPGSDGSFIGSFRLWRKDGDRRVSDDSEMANDMSTRDDDASAVGRGGRGSMTSRAGSRAGSRTGSIRNDQRDSWLSNLISPVSAPTESTSIDGTTKRPATLRAPSWSHFRAGSTVTAPIMEEGENNVGLVPGSAISADARAHSLNFSHLSKPGSFSAGGGSPLPGGLTGSRDERWGSTFSGMSLGTQDSGADRELANMDRLIDQAVEREFNKQEKERKDREMRESYTCAGDDFV